MLIQGDTFKKYKGRTVKNRSVWCSPLLDFLIWGDTDQVVVKGFICTADIQEVNQGFGRNKCRLYLVTSSRTLELEAKSVENAREWLEAFEFLIKSQTLEREKRTEILKAEGVSKELEISRQDHVRLLTEGDVFKKWPGKKMLQKGSFAIRRIWCDAKLDKIYWGDVANSKVRGFIQMEDIIHVVEDLTDPEGLRFTLVAVERSLELEATTTFTRSRWVRAFRYFINDRKLRQN